MARVTLHRRAQLPLTVVACRRTPFTSTILPSSRPRPLENTSQGCRSLLSVQSLPSSTTSRQPRALLDRRPTPSELELGAFLGMTRPSLADELSGAFDDDLKSELYSSLDDGGFTHGGRALSLAEEFGLDLFDGDDADNNADGEDAAGTLERLSDDHDLDGEWSAVLPAFPFLSLR